MAKDILGSQAWTADVIGSVIMRSSCPGQVRSPIKLFIGLLCIFVDRNLVAHNTKEPKQAGPPFITVPREISARPSAGGPVVPNGGGVGSHGGGVELLVGCCPFFGHGQHTRAHSRCSSSPPLVRSPVCRRRWYRW
jgi:hypothetical protein